MTLCSETDRGTEVRCIIPLEFMGDGREMKTLKKFGLNTTGA